MYWALRQYEHCATILDEELGVKPSKRTIALYKQILAEQIVEPEPILTPAEAQPAPTSTPTTTQPPLGLSTSPLLESLGYLIQLQEFLTNLQNQVQQSIQKMQQGLNDNPNPPHPPKDDEEKTL